MVIHDALDPEAVALLYSGGTDSTLAAYKAGRRFATVHLLTYQRFGMFQVENSETNVDRLLDALPATRFVRPPIISIDDLFNHVSSESYLQDLRRYRFMLLTTCGLCKLAMHIRTIVYCLDNSVGNVWDGANKNMTIFPAQMDEVLVMLRDLYQLAGVRYDNPVYDYEDVQGINFGSILYGQSPAREGGGKQRTTSTELHDLGILPTEDVKGTPFDKKMQGRCYQFALFNLWARWYYLERRSMDEYRTDVIAYYSDKIDRCRAMVSEFVDRPQTARLRTLAGSGR